MSETSSISNFTASDGGTTEKIHEHLTAGEASLMQLINALSPFKQNVEQLNNTIGVLLVLADLVFKDQANRLSFIDSYSGNLDTKIVALNTRLLNLALSPVQAIADSVNFQGPERLSETD